jgi:hypothetical protein
VQVRPTALITPIAVLLVGALIVFILVVSSSANERPPATIWFNDLEASPPLSPLAQEAVIRWVRTSLDGKLSGPGPLPENLTADKAPRLVFISVSDGRISAHVALGSGLGVVEAAGQALTFLSDEIPRGLEPRWIKLDLVTHAHSIDAADPLLEIEKSLEGLAFSAKSGLALLPEQLVSRALLNDEQRLQSRYLSSYLKEKRLHGPGTQRLRDARDDERYRFSTASLFLEGQTVTPLYRGHRQFNQPSRGMLLEAAISGGSYLVRAVEPNGRFLYSYQADKDEARDKYNILRHAGTIYSMLELYQTTADPDLLNAAKKAIDYLLTAIESCTTQREAINCVVEGGYTKLGGNALAAIAFAHYARVTGDPQYNETIRALGSWIVQSQRTNGSFAIHKQTQPEGTVTDFVSGYYPGEALLALLRIYALEPSDAWLEAAEKGAQYLIRIRDSGLAASDLPHDHWLLYALNELHRHRPKAEYADHAFAIATAIISAQNRNPRHPDWYGSFYKPPRSTPTATRMEGLSATYHLARRMDRAEDMRLILDALSMGATFQLHTQFRPESALYLPDPTQALGGFHRSLSTFEVRIDYVQHNISSLLALYRIMGEP